MKAILYIILIIVIIFGGVLIWRSSKEPEPITNNGNINNIMNIKSPAFVHNSSIPEKYTCDGDNVNPPLEISDVPSGAKSLALIVDDPDANPLWTHWVLWNISPSEREIKEASTTPSAVEGI